MLVAIGRIVDKNNMIEGLRIYDTKAKTSKDIRIEYVPKNVVNLNQANKLGTINKDCGEEKPVILLDIRNNLAHIVSVNGEEKTVTSISELNRYTVIRCKSDVELYKEYIQKTQETRLKFKIENGKVSIVNFETNNRGIEVVEIPSFVSSIEGFVFRNTKVRELKINSNNVMIDDMSNVFNGCKSDYIDLSKFNFRAIKNMFGMMYSCSNLKRVDLNSLENSVTNNLQGVFVNCKKLKEVDLSGLDTTNVIYANSMFENCISLETIRFDKFRVDKLISIVSIFKNCKKLTYIKWGANLDLSNIDCNSAFYGCENLCTLSISTLKLDSSKHKHCTDYMFYGCKKLADIGDVEYRNCRSAVSMFEGCKSLHKLTFRLWTWDININERRLDEQLVLCDNTFKDCSKLESVNFGNLCLIYQHHKGYSNDWEPVSLDFRDTFRGCKSLRKVTMGGYYEGLGFMDETINKIMLEKHKDDMRKHSKMGRRVEIHIK